EFHRNRKNLRRAAAVSDEALALAPGLENLPEPSPELLDRLSAVHLHAARVYEDLGEPEEMRGQLQKAMGLAQRVDALRPTAESKHGLELVLSDLSDLHQSAGDVDRALALMSSALEYGELGQKLDPGSRLIARSSARTRGEVAHLKYDVEAPSMRDLD